MSDIAIKVENLSKMYQIGEKQERYYTFRDTLTNIALAPFRRLRRIGKPTKEEEIIWALKDVSFEVKHGEVVGIIGRNGAGKTTLLKILSRITEPTEGQAEIHGRVGSLLEVGTGFHPELTGRENIFLNGAILGMRKTEINRKFDEIVDFAEIEKFMDTPVKRYSSGMYVRLAFAVAAHLEPEILLVDEVLAVGDAAFQKKCLGKMGNVAKEGRTVLFVSHNMAAIENLCPRVLLLNNGLLELDGNSQYVLSQYQGSILDISSVPISERKDRRGEGGIKIHNVQIADSTDSNLTPLSNIRSGQNVSFIIEFTAERDFRQLEFGLSFSTLAGAALFYCDTQITHTPLEIHRGHGRVICTIDSFPLAPGRYSFNVNAFLGGVFYDWVIDAGTFSVDSGDFWGTGAVHQPGHSPFLVQSRWEKGVHSCLGRK